MSETQFQHCKPSEMSREQFVERFGGIYEHSAWIAEAVYDEGLDQQCDCVETLRQRMEKVLREAATEQQMSLIQAHPDLAGKAAVAGELTSASTSEQSGAGIHLCTPEEFELFNMLNHSYRAKFQFPFIMAVKGSNRHQIIAAFERRIHHSVEEEFKQALIEINKIAEFRLAQC